MRDDTTVEDLERVRKSGQRLTKGQRKALKELKRHVTMQTCNFDMHHFDAEKLPQDVNQVDAFIKERTRVWRQSWIYPLIDALLGDEWDTTIEEQP